MSTLITEATGNLLTAPVEALVNTVNTEGVMGKGIALQFKMAFPEMFKDYRAAAKRGEINLGRMHVWATQTLDSPSYIINFPTKGHWRSKSRLADIDSGLEDLVRIVRETGISSIAIPPLGCGNGGLRWAEVEPRIRAAFNGLPDVEVLLYPPAGVPKAASMPVNSPKPKMTLGRAALVSIIAGYTKQALDAPSLIETQKLMYFLQMFGEELRLDFKADRYGPYADNLRHVLAHTEGHFLIGYGDGSAKVSEAAPLEPVASIMPLVEQELNSHPETLNRVERVLRLAEGFETAYGMELLATVHWIATRDAVGEPVEVIAANVANWSPRKARMFTPNHVDTAFNRLSKHRLLSAPSRPSSIA